VPNLRVTIRNCFIAAGGGGDDGARAGPEQSRGRAQLHGASRSTLYSSPWLASGALPVSRFTAGRVWLHAEVEEDEVAESGRRVGFTATTEPKSRLDVERVKTESYWFLKWART
jgi:hypothetical protein